MNIGGISGSSTTNILAGLVRTQAALAKSNTKIAANSELPDMSYDPARYMMAMRLRSSASSYTVARNNAQDGTAMLQTAETGMTSVHDMLAQIRTLADQWNNGTGNKTSITQQVTDLNNQIKQTIANTSFNGQTLLAGGSATTLQIGPNAGDTVSITNPALTGVIGTSVDNFQTASMSSTINTAALDNALTGVQNAMNTNNAFQSQLGFAIDNANNQIEIASGAASKITDLDIAKESTTNMKLMLQAQIQTALLAQANQQSQTVFHLLYGK